MDLVNILLTAVGIENMALVFFLGMCSFLACSKKVETATGLGLAVIFVQTITVPVNWFISHVFLSKGALAWTGVPALAALGPGHAAPAGPRHDPRRAQLGELVTDRLDTPSQTFLVLVTDVLVDIPHDQRCGRSSSAAKKADALLRIALARLSSAFSRFNRFSSADSSLVVPTRCPASTSA